MMCCAAAIRPHAGHCDLKDLHHDETMRNAALAGTWLAKGGNQAGMAAVTAAPDVAAVRGIAADRIFDFDEGVGGVIRCGQRSVCR